MGNIKNYLNFKVVSSLCRTLDLIIVLGHFAMLCNINTLCPIHFHLYLYPYVFCFTGLYLRCGFNSPKLYDKEKYRCKNDTLVPVTTTIVLTTTTTHAPSTTRLTNALNCGGITHHLTNVDGHYTPPD